MTLQTSYVNVCLQYVSLKNRYPLTPLLEDHCFPISNIINVSIMYPKKYTCSHTCMYAHACVHIHRHTHTHAHTQHVVHIYVNVVTCVDPSPLIETWKFLNCTSVVDTLVKVTSFLPPLPLPLLR